MDMPQEQQGDSLAAYKAQQVRNQGGLIADLDRKDRRIRALECALRFEVDAHGALKTMYAQAVDMTLPPAKPHGYQRMTVELRGVDLVCDYDFDAADGVAVLYDAHVGPTCVIDLLCEADVETIEMSIEGALIDQAEDDARSAAEDRAEEILSRRAAA